MGFLLIIAVAFVAAEDVVELEPVQAALTQTCSNYNGLGRAACHTYPACYYTLSTEKCDPDPCYRWISEEAAGNDCLISGQTLPCAVKTFGTYTSDCSTTPTTVKTNKYCSGQDNDPATMTACEYEYLKSNKTKCPSYFCQVSGVGTIGTFEICDAVTGGGCPDNSKCECLTEDYCALNPYCYVHNHNCIEDLCTDYFDTDGQGCASRKDVQAAYSINDDCMAFTIFDGETGHANGATKDLCVNSKRNKTPNKCYFLSNDYTSTGSGDCEVYSIPKCAENEECKVETNTTGPYAAFYCGDAGHTSSSISVHAPAIIMIVLAVLAFLL